MNSLLTMGRVTRAVADKHAVEMVSHFLNGIVVGETGDAASSAD